MASHEDNLALRAGWKSSFCFAGDYEAGKYYVAFFRHSDDSGGWRFQWLFPRPGSSVIDASAPLAETPLLPADTVAGSAILLARETDSMRDETRRLSRRALAITCLGALALGARAPTADSAVPVTSVSSLSRFHPALREMLEMAAGADVQRVGLGDDRRLRIVSTPLPLLRAAPGASGVGRWAATARPLAFEAREDDLGGFEIRARGDAPIAMRRLGRGVARGSVDGGALVVAEASPGVDAVVLARDRSIEELLVVRDPRAEPGYELDLPRGWSLHRAAPAGLVEIRDARRVAQLRVWVRAGWDAAGNEVRVAPEVDGHRLRISVAGARRWPVVIDPEWQDTGNMVSLRSDHTATLLPDGTVLLAGGCVPGPGGCVDAEVFDPATRRFTAAPPMIKRRKHHTATMLGTGHVLIAGGYDPADGYPSTLSTVQSAELFDPVTGQFEAVAAPMSKPHFAHTATRLAGGRVILAGGTFIMGLGGGTDVETEIYDPVTNQFLAAADMSTPRSFHGAVRLASGDVLIVGRAGIDRYDPAADHFAALGAMQTPFEGHTTTLLHDGLVLVAGGNPPTATAELINPSTGQSSGPLDLLVPRSRHAATLLPEGALLLTGGYESGAVKSDSAELQYADGAADAQIEPHMSAARARHTSTLLLDGTVLVAGGNEATQWGEIFEPSAGESMGHGDLPSGPDPMALVNQAVPLMDGHVLITRVDVQGWHLAVFDPATGTAQWLPTIDGFPTDAVTATVLSDGMVLVVGSGEAILSNPLGGLLPSAVPSPSFLHEGHSATLLSNGNVLIAGGAGPAELYDPATKTFTATGELSTTVSKHAATLLPDGRVLVAGGEGGSTTVQIYDPVTGQFNLAGSLVKPRVSHTATLLPTGKVLLAGGSMTPSSAEIYDPATGKSVEIAAMTSPRAGHTATLLLSGRVAITGGSNADASVDVFDPSTETFRATGALTQACASHAATLLPSGRLLVVAGASCFAPKLPCPGGQCGRWEIWAEDARVDDTLRPALSAVPSAVAGGAVVSLGGSRLEGISEASSGTTSSSPTDYPISLWMPIGRGVPGVGTLAPWSETSATWTVPATPFPGPGLLFVIANGTRSGARFVTITPLPLGAACQTAGQCASGICTDGVCCDSACGGTCVACTAAKKGSGSDGTCGAVAAGLPHQDCPVEDVKLCSHNGVCAEAGQCAVYAEGTTCAPGATCNGGACVGDSGGRACDGDHEIVGANGTAFDCEPYRCSAVTNQCLTTCRNNRDCVDGLACSVDGRCEAPIEDGPPASCAVSAPGRRTTAGWLAALALASRVTRRRRPISGRRTCSRGPRPGCGGGAQAD